LDVSGAHTGQVVSITYDGVIDALGSFMSCQTIFSLKDENEHELVSFLLHNFHNKPIKVFIVSIMDDGDFINTSATKNVVSSKKPCSLIVRRDKHQFWRFELRAESGLLIFKIVLDAFVCPQQVPSPYFTVRQQPAKCVTRKRTRV
jgi:hypothetical protein